MSLLVATLVLAAPPARLPDFTWNTYNTLRERIALTREERTFYTLPWQVRPNDTDPRPVLQWSVRGGYGTNLSAFGVDSRQGFLSSNAARDLRDRVQWVIRPVSAKSDEGFALLSGGRTIKFTVAADPATVRRDLAVAYEFPAGSASKVAQGRAVIRVISRDLARTPGSYNMIELPLDPLAFGTLASRKDPGQILANLLATKGFIDNARGSALPFTAENVEKAVLNAGPRSGNGEMRLAGQILTGARGEWSRDADENPEPIADQIRGMDLKLLGSLNFDAASSQIRRFEVVAVGKRWGAQPFNRRINEPGATDIGFVVTLEPAWLQVPGPQTNPK